MNIPVGSRLVFKEDWNYYRTWNQCRVAKVGLDGYATLKPDNEKTDGYIYFDHPHLVGYIPEGFLNPVFFNKGE